jgi:hypothetical protein
MGLAVAHRQHRAGHARDTNPPRSSPGSDPAATETIEQAWLQDLRALRPVSPGPLAGGVALRSGRVTASGCDTMDAWEAATSSIWAFPRSAMNRCPPAEWPGPRCTAGTTTGSTATPAGPRAWRTRPAPRSLGRRHQPGRLGVDVGGKRLGNTWRDRRSAGGRWVTTGRCRSEAAMALSRVERRVRQNPMHGSTRGLEMEQPRPRQPLTRMRPSSPPRSSGLVSSRGRAADGRHQHRGIVPPCRWFSPGRCVSAREAAVPATSSLSARIASGVRG